MKKYIVATDQKYYPMVWEFDDKQKALDFYEEEKRDEKWNDGKPVKIYLAEIITHGQTDVIE